MSRHIEKPESESKKEPAGSLGGDERSDAAASIFVVVGESVTASSRDEPGRGERIRTSGLYVPNVALYQAKLHPAFRRLARPAPSPAAANAATTSVRTN